MTLEGGMTAGNVVTGEDPDDVNPDVIEPNQGMLQEDWLGQDMPHVVCEVEHNGQTYQIDDGGYVDIPTELGGTLRMYSTGEYKYTAPDSLFHANKPLHLETGEDVPDWVMLTAYGKDGQPATVLDTANGFGIDSNNDGGVGGRFDEINYVDGRFSDGTEKLSVALKDGLTVQYAKVIVTAFFPDESGVGDERGKYELFRDGAKVGEGEFVADDASGEHMFEINFAGGFDEIQFTALKGTFDFNRGDSSDYYVESIWFGDAMNFENFTYTLKDSDGSSDKAELKIKIKDTEPDAKDDKDMTLEGGMTEGNVITGFDPDDVSPDEVEPNEGMLVEDWPSQDEPHIIKQIRVGDGDPVDVPDGGYTDVQGDYGTLRIWSNGNYKYTAADSVHHKAPALPDELHSFTFDDDAEGFVYVDDAFNGTNEPNYADGSYEAAGGFGSDGGLRVVVGNVDNDDITDMSGAFRTSFNLAEEQHVVLMFKYKANFPGAFEGDENGQVLVGINGAQHVVDEFNGDSAFGDTGWLMATVDLGVLAAGDHDLDLGGFVDEKTFNNEFLTIDFDDIKIKGLPAGHDVKTGLWGEAHNKTSSIESLAEAQAVVDDTPSATFMATTIDYGGGDNFESLSTFLGGDGASLSGTNHTMNTIVLTLNGFIFLEAGTHTFNVTSDDGYRLTIDGQNVVEANLPQAPTTDSGNIVIAEDGYYSFDAIWYENGGGQVLSMTHQLDGGPEELLSAGRLFKEVPVENVDALYDEFTYTLADGDWSMDDATLTIKVKDTAPDAKDDKDMVLEGGMTRGNVITGNEPQDEPETSQGMLQADWPSQDEPLTIKQVMHDDKTYELENGEVTFTTELGGEITFYEDGSYKYTAPDCLDHSELCVDLTNRDETESTDGIWISARNIDGTDGDLSFDATWGMGVRNTSDGGEESPADWGNSAVPNQLNHAPDFDDTGSLPDNWIDDQGASEAIIIDLHDGACGFSFEYTRAIQGEGGGGSDGGEIGRWQAFDGDGNLIGTGLFGQPETVTSGRGVGNVEVDADDLNGMTVAKVVFTALPYAAGDTNPNDSSDYFIREFKAEPAHVEEFKYTLADGDWSMDDAVLSIKIKDDAAPIANDDMNMVMAGMPLQGNDDDPMVPDPVVGNVIGDGGQTPPSAMDVADIDPNGDDTLLVVHVDGHNDEAGNMVDPIGEDIVIQGMYGELTIDSDGDYSYDLNDLNPDVLGLQLGQMLDDVFTYKISDGKKTDTAELKITIKGNNDGPTAKEDSNVIQELMGETDDVDNNVSGNVLMDIDHSMFGFIFEDQADMDPDLPDDTLTVVGVKAGDTGANFMDDQTLGVEIQGQYGTVIINADGSYIYELDDSNPLVNSLPNVNVEVQDRFTYTIMDEGGKKDHTLLTISIRGNNDGPTIVKADDANVSEEGLQDGKPDDDGMPDTTDDAVAMGQVVATDPDLGDMLFYSLSVPNPDPMLESDGFAIVFADEGGDIVGRADGNEIIRVSIDGAGKYTATLSGPVDHPDDSKEDGVSFDVGVTVTDKGGKTDDTTVTITIEDDSPMAMARDDVDPDMLVLDESPVGEDSAGGDLPVGTMMTTADFSDNFVTPVQYGADGPGSVSYMLMLNGDDVPSGLYALDLSQADGQGEQIVLNMVGDDIVGTAMGGTEYFRIELTGNPGEVKFSQSENIWHGNPANHDDEEALTTPNVDDIKIVQTVSDNDDDSASASIGLGGGNVFKIQDDGPVAKDDCFTICEGGGSTTDIVLIIDRSGSMAQDPDGGGGFATRLDLVKAAVADLLGQPGVQSVMVVDFAGSASHQGWDTPANALAYVNGLGTGGTTNYSAAINELMSNYDTGANPRPPAADETRTFFLSDGAPNGAGTGLGDTGLTNAPPTDDDPLVSGGWINFLIDNNITESHAVGVGAGIVDAEGDLEEVAFPDSASNPIILINETDLSDTLVTIVTPTVDGNILDDNGNGEDMFGTDGPNGVTSIMSIEVDGTTYMWDGTDITNNMNADVVNSSILMVTTVLGGELEFDFATGDFEYRVPQVDQDEMEQFTYTIKDADGDTDQGLLKIEVQNAPSVTIDDAMADEGDPLVFKVSLDGTSGDPIVLDLMTVGGTADDGVDYENSGFEVSTNGVDFVPAGGGNGTEITFAPGETMLWVRIDTTEDDENEDDETMTLKVAEVLDGKVADFSDIGHGLIKDDDNTTPVAKPDCYHVDEQGTVTTDVVLVVDHSGSMGDDPGVAGFSTRLELLQAAVADLLGQPGVQSVMVVDFDGSAGHQGWGTPADAITFVNGLVADGTTNYSAAVNEVIDNFDTPANPRPPAADETRVFFLSDGAPFPDTTGLGDTGLTNAPPSDDDPLVSGGWVNFLIDENITEVHAVGIGSGIVGSDDDLEEVAWPNSADNPIILTDEGALSDTLVQILASEITGNILTDDTGNGADMFMDDGQHPTMPIAEIVIDGITYTYDPNNDEITNDDNGDVVAGNTLTVDTDLGGGLVINLQTGDFTYTAPQVNAAQQELFQYSIKDTDGEVSPLVDFKIDINDTTPGPFASDVKQTISLSTTSGSSAGGETFTDGDVMQFDGITVSTLFDESNFTGDEDIDAVHVFTGPGVLLPGTAFEQAYDAGDMLLSTSGDASLPGIGGNFDNDDIIFWDASAGTASIFANVGQSNVDALSVNPDTGDLIFSLSGSGFGGEDGDLFQFDGTSVSVFFDEDDGFGAPGSDEGFGNASVDVDGAHVLGNGEVILTTTGSESLGGVGFENGDLVHWDGTTATVILEEDSFFSGNENIDAVDPPQGVVDELLEQAANRQNVNYLSTVAATALLLSAGDAFGYDLDGRSDGVSVVAEADGAAVQLGR